MPSLVELREQVRQILTGAFGNVSVDGDGDYSIRNESARIFIRCYEQQLSGDSTRTLVLVWSIVLSDVPPSPELFRHIATLGSDYVFGHLHCREHEGSVMVNMSHKLLGDYLDSEELIATVVGIAVTANELDEELQGRFGGSRFHED